jgi:hypothetical protein
LGVFGAKLATVRNVWVVVVQIYLNVSGRIRSNGLKIELYRLLIAIVDILWEEEVGEVPTAVDALLGVCVNWARIAIVSYKKEPASAYDS